ncbi:MAG TPA: hypothetical protein VHO48_13505 [Anaerolineaceae bacterium]|nr:hypothetical protein [Anaerolineaceae bacterium]
MSERSAVEAAKGKLSISRRSVWILALACLVSLGASIVASGVTYRLGFPLDDAWIHQTYARNLAQRFEWSFVPGQPSGGSTSPLWTGLLAIGYLLHLPPIAWVYLLGWGALFCLSVLGEAAYRWYFPGRSMKLPWVGLILAFEWHLAWAAGSGMETLVVGLLFTFVLLLMPTGRARWWVLGLLAGVSVWLRPDGLTLLGPLGMSAVMIPATVREKGKKLISFGFGFLAAFLPYVAFTRWLTGSWWPNTFYAKQAEYAALRTQPILARIWSEFRVPLVGVGILLLAGFIWFIWTRAKAKDWAVIAGGLWWLGYIGLYAWRLPVTYQYGRYVMPALPLFFCWGAMGSLELMKAMRRSSKTRLIARAWGLTLIVVTGLFWGNGVAAYARDVAIIETEMVNPARWIAANTQPGDLIAAHDIGALGYFGDRPVIDLAGLISPEVIPFIRDEDKIGPFLDERQVDYLLVTFDWYPLLAQQAEQVYESEGGFLPDRPGENTRIYRWGRP